MPSLLTPPFPQLIRALPVADHSIEVTAGDWQPKFQAVGQSDLWRTIFAGRPSVRLSRNRLHTFAYPDPKQKCAEILLWGYPSDQRGRASKLLPALEQLPILSASTEPWPSYFEALDAVNDIGISTITKLAHFHSRTFEGLQALILDNRLIGSTARWQEVHVPGLSYHSAPSCYLDYLRAMNAAAMATGATAAQLELFLFSLGDSF